jgi:hypothetical protein
MPADALFKSLAESGGDSAIAVVLSGGDSDGAHNRSNTAVSNAADPWIEGAIRGLLLRRDPASALGLRRTHVRGGAADVPRRELVPSSRSIPRRARVASGVEAFLPILVVAQLQHRDPTMGCRSSPPPCLCRSARRPSQPGGLWAEARRVAGLRAVRRRCTRPAELANYGRAPQTTGSSAISTVALPHRESC